jgi:hypothetical protein
MPILIVRAERKLQDLGPRLGRTGRARLDAATIRAIRDANPQVDLDALAPGVVLTIPEGTGLRVPPEAASNDLIGEGLEAVVANLGRLVDTLVERSEAQARTESADRAVVRRSLGLRAVEAAAAQDRELQQELGRVEEALAAADATAEEASGVRKQTMATWREDLAAIARLPG